MKRALIFGVGGQDGSYLATHLLQLGYDVWGTSRDAHASTFANLVRLGVLDDVRLESAALTDFRSVLQVLKTARPDEVYNLAGQSSVGLSFQQPIETLESIAIGTLNLLEAIRFTGEEIRFYNAGSGECFGETPEAGANEQTPLRPRSPYAIAKATAHWQVLNHREAYGMYAASGILFNHESPLRPARFVTQKIAAAAAAIAGGETSAPLVLGNTDITRDWGWAPEYVEAMHLMLQAPSPGDYVIATGESHSLLDFVAAVFEAVDLDWQQHVEIDTALRRPTDIAKSYADPAKAARELNWKARSAMRDVARMMVQARMEMLAAPSAPIQHH